MRIHEETPQDKYDRYDDMQEALSTRGWSGGSTEVCHVAAFLAQRTGDVEEIAERFRELEKAIVATSRDDSVESGLAALILLDEPGTDKEKAARFSQTFEAMVAQGWKRNTDIYAAAAIISLVPRRASIVRKRL